MLFRSAATSFAGIALTDHDLSNGTGPSAQICIYCHTPHNAKDVVEPLWNATVSVASFTAYTSATFDGTATMDSDPVIGPSRLCMSCHDGTVAIDSAIGGTTTFIGSIDTGSGLIGTDLSNDHPIGFNYDAAQALDDELFASDVANSYAGATIGDFLFGANKIMTCATCHDVHDDTNGSFLLVGNGASALCLSCHDK